jgi:restriction endonuclease S subunit
MKAFNISQPPPGWAASDIGSLVTFFTGGTPFLKSEYSKSGTPVLTKGDVKPFGRVEHSGRFVDTDLAVRARYRFTTPEDLLVTTRDLTTEADFLGLVAPVPADRPYLVNQGANVFQLNPDLVNRRYFLYWTASSIYRNHIKSAVSGSTQIHIRKADWLAAPVWLPPRREQERIGAALGALDDKIELNRRMSQTLEAIAQAIFKSWFVDSTPDTGQPSTLKDLTSKIGSGATPRGGRDVYVDEGAALIRSQNVYDSQFVWDGLARILDEAATQLANVQVQPGDVLLNITGASILRTCVVPPDVLPARVNQHVAIIRAKPGVSPHYLHLHLLQPETKAYLLGLNAGGSREAVTKAHIESAPIINPGEDVLGQFHGAVAPLFAQAQACATEARWLASLRDALLPKLLSGELAPAAA